MKTFIEDIFRSRFFYMGVSILMILAYHINQEHNLFPQSFTGKGYYGVDIFLFFSALGLGFSYEKYSLRVFYKRRICRIVPIYMILIIYMIIIDLLKGNTNWGGYFISIIGLNYLDVFTKFRVDWYLGCLLFLYLTYPIIFEIVKKIRNHYIGLVLIIILSGFTLYKVSLPWYYQCFIGRIPIWYLGVFVYINRGRKKDVIKVFILYTLLATILLIYENKIEIVKPWCRFFTCSFAAPAIMYVTYTFHKCVYNIKPIENFINFVGKYSLEIYVANAMAIASIRLFGNIHVRYLIELLLDIFGPIGLNVYNRTILKYVKYFR